jgi:sec-independent protein translocase protein TatA
MTNPLHIALIALVLLLIFGAKRLPELGRSLGSGLREFKGSINGADELQPLPLASSDAEANPSHSLHERETGHSSIHGQTRHQ